MDGISVLNPSTPAFQPLLYSRGNAVGWLARSDKTASAPYNMSGRLYLAKSGWLLLSVPNAFVRGVFDALTAPGAELPTAGLMNVPNVDGDVLNAHISVMTADEVEAIGADKINERGHMFHYALGPVEEIPVHNVDGVSKVWAVQIKSPALAAIRKSYGLAPYIHNNHQFHITVAARRKNVLKNNEISKFDAATGRGELKAAADDKTTYDCCCSGPCSCPPTCVCKKSGSCGGHKSAEELPWRERVEVYTRHPQTGKIYGGVWDGDKSFAVPGGGLDPGETPEQAAVRELEEETGIKATNPVRLPIPAVDHPWSDKTRAEKAKVGRGNFAGSRTHFVMVDFLDKIKNKQLDKWDATKRRFYDPAKALALMSGKQFMAPAVAAGRMAALKHIIENAAKKTAADLLPGGAADNKPDSAFDPDELKKGKKHEHEHTNNDQVATEIAKDHLQEEPDYYQKHSEEEVSRKEPAIIFQLRKAKEHSDAKRYAQKNEILRKLMHRAPDEWMVDDPEAYHMGITHVPTRFRFHADPKIIPVGVPVQKAANKNPYAGHLFDFREPLVVKPNANVWDMTLAHLKRVVDKGNWTAQAQQNTPKLFAAMDPNYKHQMNMAIARGVWPQPDLLTQLIQRHGSGVLSSLG